MPIQRILIKEKQMQFDLDYSTSKAGKKQFIKSGSNRGKPKMKMKSPAKYKNELDIRQIYQLFENQDVIIIEKQAIRPGNAAASSASTMKNYGKLLALAELSGAKLVLIAPNTWKAYFNLNMKPAEKKLLTQTQYKQLSIDKASQLSGSKFTKDGPADATCIGQYYIKIQGNK